MGEMVGERVGEMVGNVVGKMVGMVWVLFIVDQADCWLDG